MPIVTVRSRLRRWAVKPVGQSSEGERMRLARRSSPRLNSSSRKFLPTCGTLPASPLKRAETAAAIEIARSRSRQKYFRKSRPLYNCAT
jgi:hypothetical protein